MIENVLHHLGGTSAYGVISVCLFFGFFLGLLLWSARLRKPYLDAVRVLPLQDGDPIVPARPAASGANSDCAGSNRPEEAPPHANLSQSYE